MSPGTRSLLRRWLFGILTGIAAAALRASLQPLIGDQLPFVIAFPATVFAAVAWGVGPAIPVALICAAAIALPQVPPELAPSNRPLQIGTFLLGSLLLATVCGPLARPRRSAVTPASATSAETAASQWLRATLWGAFLIPLLAFVIVAWWGFDRAQREAEATVTHACELAYRQAQRTFAIAADIAARADAAASGDDDAARRNEAEIHRRLADMTSGLPSVVNLNIWDAQGRPIARSDVFPVDPKASVADRAYFQEQQRARLPLGVSEVIHGRQTGKELLNATIRRASPDGSFRGVVAVSLSPGFFRDFYESLSAEQPNLASFALIRTDGEILARWPVAPDQRTHVPEGSSILAQVTAGARTGTVLIPENNGRETRIAGFKRLDDYPLYVVAGVSRAAMFAGWGRFVGLLAAILFPTAAVLVFVTWVALNKTLREAGTALELQEQVRRRASAEKSMLQSQKLETLAVVTGGVAHDFNNLLAIVNTSLHIHKRQHPELAQEKQLLAMGRAIQSGVRLTRQLLSFARKQSLRPEIVELQSWLPGIEGLIRTTLGPSVSWQLHVEPDTRPVCVDVGELELALINLVVNARHAMPQGGLLSVRAGNASAGTRGEGARVSIAVQDSGVGIPPEYLAKVFEPFFTTRTQGAGSGLGLSQVQGFCTAAGGAVRIDSAVGAGTTVWMDLPASSEAAPQELAEAAPIPQLAGRVLLVEDNEDVAATTEMMLRDAGLDVIRHVTADAAWGWLQNAPTLPDAVLSDIAMPGTMDGVALAFALRERFPALPVLLTTGYAERHHEAIEAGLSVMSKPVAPQVLLEALGAAIRRGRAA
jgi:two-component system NtrC family sensor kinase